MPGTDYKAQMWFLDGQGCIGDVTTPEDQQFELECGFPPHTGDFVFVMDKELYGCGTERVDTEDQGTAFGGIDEFVLAFRMLQECTGRLPV